jgi:hypothetical protein
MYYKHITIKNDDSSIVNMWLESFTDGTKVVIYDCNMFIIQATGFIVQSTLIMIVNYDRNTFIVQATDYPSKILN